MLEAAIFDMDGLLIDSEPLWHKAEKKVFASLGLNLTTEMCLQTTGIRVDEVVRHWYRRHPWQGKPLEKVTDEIIEEVHHLCLVEGQALQGVESILDFFARRDFRIALASSSPRRMIEAVVEKLGIGHYFSVLCSAAEEELGKPHPSVYLTTAARLGVASSHCLAFEDSFPGIIAAKAASMKVVAVPDRHHYDQPRFHAADLKLASLDQFGQAQLDQLNS